MTDLTRLEPHSVRACVSDQRWRNIYAALRLQENYTNPAELMSHLHRHKTHYFCRQQHQHPNRRTSHGETDRQSRCGMCGAGRLSCEQHKRRFVLVKDCEHSINHCLMFLRVVMCLCFISSEKQYIQSKNKKKLNHFLLRKMRAIWMWYLDSSLLFYIVRRLLASSQGED